MQLSAYGAHSCGPQSVHRAFDVYKTFDIYFLFSQKDPMLQSDILKTPTQRPYLDREYQYTFGRKQN
jgi:hypothetical protein